MKPFRYLDAARQFDESLAEDLKVATREAPQEEEAGLSRIVDGDTALAGIEHTKHAAEASVEKDLQEHDVRKRLKRLVEEKTAGLDRFNTAAVALRTKEV